jgi:integrase
MLTKKPSARVPSYRHHKPTGQAVVTLNGEDIYLGKWNTKTSRAEYDRLIGEWLAGGRQLPKRGGDLTVAELGIKYLRFAEGYYRKDGRPTGSVAGIRVALRLLRQSYGHTLANDFGPLALESLQYRLIDGKKSRSTINEMIAIIRRAFRWGVAKELVGPEVHQALLAVPGLRKGRTAAREPKPIAPVADQVVDATLPNLSLVVADMIRFQRLTGCRPGEVCQLRPMDIDRSADVWVYRPASHKTEHHERDRVIFIGPKAQNLLRPYLLRAAESFCFSAAESDRQRRELRHAARKTPLSYGNRPGTNRTSRPTCRPKDRFTKDAYNRAVQRGCEQTFGMPKNLRSVPGKLSPREEERLAKLPAKERQEAIENAERERKRLQGLAAAWRAEHCWSPNQLRHAAGTEVRRLFGLEAAQVILGHAKADVTQVYAERDMAMAAEIMRKIG